MARRFAARPAGLPSGPVHYACDNALIFTSHTGNNLTAQAGAKLRELMERMGHSSARAALIYLHATAERQRSLAAALGTLIEVERVPDQDVSGTDVARHGQDGADITKPKSVDLG